jgi:uncharacterized phage-associated protein
MFNAIDISKYFFAKDLNRDIFNLNLIERNGRIFYEGNAKMNKFLHLAQNTYIAKTGEPLFSDDLYAYDNGAVALNVVNDYAIMQRKEISKPDFGDDINEFLERLFIMLKGADIDELIDLSHEDEEWMEKSRNYKKADQKMDSISRAEEYKKQYADALMIMYRMDSNKL